MGPVWLQGTIHASYNRIHHQSAAHLSAAGLSWLWASVQPFPALQLSQRLGRGRGRSALSSAPQISTCVQLWPPPAVSPTGGGSSSWKRQLKPSRETWSTETLSFSVLEPAAVKPV